MTADNNTPAPFDILDADRNNEFNRFVLSHLGSIEPRIDETDDFVSMPMRLVYDQAAGWHLELGPYDLSRADIDRLRQAIAAFDAATAPAEQ